jgi:hypothetical protein
MEPVSRDVIGHLSQTRVIFRAALMSCSSLVSLRAVYRDCLVSVEHCSVTVTMGFASGEPHTAITASPMLRVSKRLTANVFREPEVEAGTSAADAAHTEAARLSMSAARWKGPLRSRISRSGWDHLFAGDGTTWLAILPVMGPPGVASGLPVVRPLHWPNEPPGVGDRDHGDPAAVAAGSGFARGGPAVGHRPQDGAPLSGQGPRVRPRPTGAAAS